MSNIKHAGLVMVVFGLTLGAASQASAGTILTFDFTGGSGADAFSGSFSYDLATPGFSRFFSIYQPSPAFPISFSIEKGGDSYSATLTDPNRGYIEISLLAIGGNFTMQLSGPGSSKLILNFDDSNEDVITSAALPTTIDFSKLDNAFAIGSNADGSLTFEGNLTSLSLRLAAVGVPEPSTVVSASIASLIALAAYRRKRIA